MKEKVNQLEVHRLHPLPERCLNATKPHRQFGTNRLECQNGVPVGGNGVIDDA